MPPTITGVEHFGLANPRGMTVNPESGILYILDSAPPRIVRIVPDSVTRFEAPQQTEIELKSLGMGEVRGIAFDPTTGHLHILSLTEKKLYEITEAGKLVAVRDLATFELLEPQGMVFAPSGDQTDDPSQLSLYVADSGLSPTGVQTLSTADSGQILELSLVPTAAPAAATVQAILVQTIDTSQFTFPTPGEPVPSPDPAGATYVPNVDPEANGTLLVSDSEVNEIPDLFTGENLFELTIDLPATLLDTMTTTSYSNEPTGVAYKPDPDPNNPDPNRPDPRRLFVSDDDKKEIFIINPGTDKDFFTADDSITSFDTEIFGSGDPEGVAFDTWQGELFIADGVNNEVYRVSPGANGIFDGVPPAGDDQVTSFDTAGLGIIDPEGITFDSDNGYLYVIGQPEDTLAHLTTDGTLVRMIDIFVANPVKPAGLAYGPGSQPPKKMNVYLTDRGVDNNSDPTENDGKVYELLIPTEPPPQFFFTPMADARVEINNPGTNYGTSDELFIDGSPEKISFLRFEVSGLTESVVSAFIQLECFNGSGPGGGGKIHLSDGNWGEDTITWENKPAIDSTEQYFVNRKIRVGEYVEFDVSNVVTETEDRTYNFAMLSNDDNGAGYYAREGISPPTLVITLADTTAPSPPSILTAIAESNQVKLDWDDNSEWDLAGYNVYRGTVMGVTPATGTWLNETTGLVTVSKYTDTTAPDGTTYYYVVTAVDFSGNESANSNEVNATPASGTPDMDSDGDSDGRDLFLLEKAYAAGSLTADMTDDGNLNSEDIAFFAGSFGQIGL